MDSTRGWWNTIVANDLDDDGDMDFIVGNLGLNAKIKASKKQPATLLAKDFDGNGIVDPIISFYKNDHCIPVATRDDLLSQIPSLKSKFPNYESYAKVRSVKEIFTDGQLAEAFHSYSHEFKSCIIKNLGNGKFTLIPLPKEAQLFPVYAIQVHDFDKDGTKDILLGGNLSRTNINYGRYDAGYGLFLQGNGSLKFQSKSMKESGISIRGDIRDIKLIKNDLVFITKSDARWQVLKY